MNDSRPPGTITVVLSGHGPDLASLALYLEAVTSGHDPAGALRDLHLDTIRITSTRGSRGRGNRITLTLQLAEADDVP